eukprot:scaffold14920_cov63-Cylindrotheca_fusiformis.AAC.7
MIIEHQQLLELALRLLLPPVHSCTSYSASDSRYPVMLLALSGSKVAEYETRERVCDYGRTFITGKKIQFNDDGYY